MTLYIQDGTSAYANSSLCNFSPSFFSFGMGTFTPHGEAPGALSWADPSVTAGLGISAGG